LSSGRNNCWALARFQQQGVVSPQPLIAFRAKASSTSVVRTNPHIRNGSNREASEASRSRRAEADEDSTVSTASERNASRKTVLVALHELDAGLSRPTAEALFFHAQRQLRGKFAAS
jgi:hypothetical protein